MSTNRVIGVYEDFEALTMALKSATGLLKQIGNIKFLGVVYLLHEEIERVWKAVEALDQEVDFLEQEPEHAEAC